MPGEFRNISRRGVKPELFPLALRLFRPERTTVKGPFIYAKNVFLFGKSQPNHPQSAMNRLEFIKTVKWRHKQHGKK